MSLLSCLYSGMDMETSATFGTVLGYWCAQAKSDASTGEMLLAHS